MRKFDNTFSIFPRLMSCWVVSVLLVLTINFSWANALIDSGGDMGTVGVLTSHSSLGSPFTTSSVTAGGIDLLYPIQSKSPTPPPEKPPTASPSGGGSVGTAPVSKKGIKKVAKKITTSNKKSKSATNKNSKPKKKSKKK
jgi:hypothetical protein